MASNQTIYHPPETPLAERLRPTDLDTFIGQEHLVGKGAPIRMMIDSGVVYSMILWGMPGIGKTTLARIIATQLKRPFYTLSAISSGVKDVRDVINKAGGDSFFGTNHPILFIDEIHRFSKAQQDSLLGAVEQGVVTLIGATTENPSFEVISALLSRAQCYVLKPLEEKHLEALLDRALHQDTYLSGMDIEVKEKNALFRLSGGDARKLLNILELLAAPKADKKLIITDELVLNQVQQRMAQYDKGGDRHYDTISAYIKSIRGSDPNAALYWLARMVQAGEDPKFIARRLVVLASEDIGNANPTALVVANACFDAVNTIGYPECEINLAHATTYLSCSAKSNSSYLALKAAKKCVGERGNLPVPLHLRNAPTNLMRSLGNAKDYQYPHDKPGHFIKQEYLPDAVRGTVFYHPADNMRETEMRKHLRARWQEKYGY